MASSWTCGWEQDGGGGGGGRSGGRLAVEVPRPRDGERGLCPRATRWRLATGEQECQDVRRSIRWVLARGRSGDGRERRAGHEAASRLLGLGGWRLGR